MIYVIYLFLLSLQSVFRRERVGPESANRIFRTKSRHRALEIWGECRRNLKEKSRIFIAPYNQRDIVCKGAKMDVLPHFVTRLNYRRQLLTTGVAPAVYE